MPARVLLPAQDAAQVSCYVLLAALLAAQDNLHHAYGNREMSVQLSTYCCLPPSSVSGAKTLLAKHLSCSKLTG